MKNPVSSILTAVLLGIVPRLAGAEDVIVIQKPAAHLVKVAISGFRRRSPGGVEL